MQACRRAGVQGAAASLLPGLLAGFLQDVSKVRGGSLRSAQHVCAHCHLGICAWSHLLPSPCPPDPEGKGSGLITSFAGTSPPSTWDQGRKPGTWVKGQGRL